ncbi:hypothetical protein BC830DRAFT_1136505 [Chytriomyces sp. MP71]|nr:hypothetical protein BC830DRAFT_1136505 [Chytriomyces sp. MP71]
MQAILLYHADDLGIGRLPSNPCAFCHQHTSTRKQATTPPFALSANPESTTPIYRKDNPLLPKPTLSRLLRNLGNFIPPHGSASNNLPLPHVQPPPAPTRPRWRPAGQRGRGFAARLARICAGRSQSRCGQGGQEYCAGAGGERHRNLFASDGANSIFGVHPQGKQLLGGCAKCERIRQIAMEFPTRSFSSMVSETAQRVRGGVDTSGLITTSS